MDIERLKGMMYMDMVMNKNEDVLYKSCAGFLIDVRCVLLHLPITLDNLPIIINIHLSLCQCTKFGTFH